MKGVNEHDMTLKEMVNQVGKNSYGYDYEMTPLMIAAEYEHFQIVQCLIEQGEADPNIANSNGLNALHWAAANNKKSTKLIQLLLNHMSLDSINKKTSLGYTPLDYAYKFNHGPIHRKIKRSLHFYMFKRWKS
eukprot:g12327.t1